ncbi:MAG: shikimate dehydrogenase [Acidiferrobacterales bacterium]|nr:shikimate dehydrogenase [Acidiferrobacterales bacterium]
MTDIFDFGPRRSLYAVFGNPIGHSKSPMVHNLFAQQFDIALEYRAVHVDIGGFEQAVSGFYAGGGQGLNVTVPFKLNAWKLADELSDRARLAGAVNTLSLGDTISGDNTDGIGLVTDIQHNLGVSMDAARILIVGAGGAARGVAGEILSAKPEHLFVANRTKDKAIDLVRQFSEIGPISGGGLDDIPSHSYEIVINATSSGLTHDAPDLPSGTFTNACLAYDMMYGRAQTQFQKLAKQCGAKLTSDGLGMLVEQAAESFFIWHRKRPETAAVIAAVREAL